MNKKPASTEAGCLFAPALSQKQRKLTGQLGGNSAEQGRKLGTKCGHGANSGYRDKCGDQTIFDSGCAFFCFKETDHGFHTYSYTLVYPTLNISARVRLTN